MAEEKREEAPSEQPQRQQQSGNETISSDALSQADHDSLLIKIYKRVGQILSQYTSGELPRACKFIAESHPELWEKILSLTEPQNWSDNALHAVTKIFSSTMRPERLEIFYKKVLLPRIRGEIRKNGRLHFALYQFLKESLSEKTFFKGILLPLCESGTCSVHEAVIIGGLMQEASIPCGHSSAALRNLSRIDYCGAVSYFIKLLLEESDGLHCLAFDAVLEHFISFTEKEATMPVIWHQSLLSFVQRYKCEMQRKDKDDIERLMQHQKHYLVTPEIERELKNSRHCDEIEGDVYQRWLIGPPARPMPIESITLPIAAAGQAGLGLLSSQAMWA
ncbi:Bystin [Rhynchospora pubera]|uniref:Bystin n=1 Tax=Rhynchospora pubera TaxID=906938 RepID=A0AAV8EWE1_9POAL|nr:Bystin [Rhynchospora pubera]